jgi:hypothetical protein
MDQVQIAQASRRLFHVGLEMIERVLKFLVPLARKLA